MRFYIFLFLFFPQYYFTLQIFFFIYHSILFFSPLFSLSFLFWLFILFLAHTISLYTNFYSILRIAEGLILQVHKFCLWFGFFLSQEIENTTKTKRIMIVLLHLFFQLWIIASCVSVLFCWKRRRHKPI